MVGRSNIIRFPRRGTSRGQRAKSTLERELITTEDWLHVAAQGAELGLWYWDEQRQALHWDLKTREMFGVPSAKSRVRLRTFVETLHPDDGERVVQVWRRSFENALPYSTEMRTLRPDGSVRWIHGRGKAYYNRAGTSLYMIGVCFDVTDRRRAEQERDELSGRLIDAQEQERKHLARELHDDFGQRLAFLSVEMARVADMTEKAPAHASTRTRQLRDVIAELGSDLHAVSHRLHSSSLEILGLAPAVASLCGEVSSQNDFEVEFHHKTVPENISPDAALSLFRIVQEGLRNAIKHSRASKVCSVARRKW